MDFTIPAEIQELKEEVDEFIENEIVPLEREHAEFFDHRREFARTDWESGGVPDEAWEELLAKQRAKADEAGLYRYMLPERLGGRGGSNLGMAIIREHLARKGPGLHNVLQSEDSIIGNFASAEILIEYGNEEQRETYLEDLINGRTSMAFGLTEPAHGSDASHMDTTAERDGEEWILNGTKRFNSGMHAADYDLVFARTGGQDGDHSGVTSFIVPTESEGLNVEYFHWTFNMPTDHAEVTLDSVRVPHDNIVGELGAGLRQAQHFVHEGRIRQAAASLGAAQFCIDESVDYANERTTWEKPLSVRQAIQFPLSELHTEAEMVRSLLYRTADALDRGDQFEVSDKVSMANYRANLLACDAADRAMQIHGGRGYTRHEPFEHIYRHHRRYRITEGTEEIQKRNIAGHLFGFIG